MQYVLINQRLLPAMQSVFVVGVSSAIKSVCRQAVFVEDPDNMTSYIHHEIKKHLQYNSCRAYNTACVRYWMVPATSIVNGSPVHTHNKKAANTMAIAFVHEKR